MDGQKVVREIENQRTDAASKLFAEMQIHSCGKLVPNSKENRRTSKEIWLSGPICMWSCSVQFSCSVVSNSLRPHGLQHTRPPCPSPSPRVYSNSCTLSWWCHPTISSSVITFSSHLQSFPTIRVFSNESVLLLRWPKYWSFSFSISPSSEYPGLMSFRMDWLDLLAVQRTLKNLLQHHSSKASIIWCSAFFIV